MLVQIKVKQSAYKWTATCLWQMQCFLEKLSRNPLRQCTEPCSQHLSSSSVALHSAWFLHYLLCSLYIFQVEISQSPSDLVELRRKMEAITYFSAFSTHTGTEGFRFDEPAVPPQLATLLFYHLLVLSYFLSRKEAHSLFVSNAFKDVIGNYNICPIKMISK